MLSLGMVTFGTIVAFIEYSHRLYNPIRDLSEKYNIYQNAHSSLEKLHALRSTEAEEGMGGAGATDVRGDIELRDVWLSYGSDGLYALKGVNLRIREGEKLGIVGLTGSGKTSLINLLLGFYLPVERGDTHRGPAAFSVFPGVHKEGLRRCLSGCLHIPEDDKGKPLRRR